MREVLALLRAGRWAEAEAPLRAALEEGSAPRGPLLGLLAQALYELGRLDEAKESCREAMREARGTGDLAGMEALRALNGRIYARLAELALPEEDPSGLEGVERLVHEAQRSAGAEALRLARRALELAASPRELVLSHLALARAQPEAAEAHLRAAHAVADEHEEAQLVAAVAKAARLAGVDFGTHRF